MTKEERKLWYEFLKTLPVTIHRQKVIGNFIADFYCAEAGVVIEVDGGGHYEEEQKKKDKEKENYLNSLGIRTLRYSNLDVLINFNGVCEDIYKNICK